MGLTLALMNQYEATIQTAAGNGNAYAIAPSNLSTTGYTVTAADATNAEEFSINRIGGTTTRTCIPATGINGGCVNGTW